MASRCATPAMSRAERLFESTSPPRQATPTLGSPEEIPTEPDRQQLTSDENLPDEAASDEDEDEEDRGTLLTGDDTVLAALAIDDITMKKALRNGDKPKALVWDKSTPLRNYRTISRNVLDTKRILDWILGRHAPTSTQASMNRAKSPICDREHVVEGDSLSIRDVQDICPACTTPYCQAVDSIPFKTSLKLSYNDPTSHEWLIGSKYILHEAIDDHPDDEHIPLVKAVRVLEKVLAPGVPVPKVIGWKEQGKVITITECVPGQRLYDIWWSLSHGERENIAEQVARYVEQWRESNLGWISNLNRGPVYHHDNLLGTFKEGFGPFRSDHDLWQAVKRRLRGKHIDPDTIRFLADYMPPSSPYVFTHGDLSSLNILVHKGKVSAIMGFDHAASLPVWAENVAMHFCCCEEDEQWKALLSKHMRSYQAALDWWSLWTAVEDTGDTNSMRIEKLKDSCRRWQKTENFQNPFDSGSSRDGSEDPESLYGSRVGGRVGMSADDLYQLQLDNILWEQTVGLQQEPGDEDDEEELFERNFTNLGLIQYNRIQPQHYTSKASAKERPPRWAFEAQGRENRKPPPKSLPLGSLSERRSAAMPVAFRDSSDADSESGFESSRLRPGGRPISREKSRLFDSSSVQSSGLRPLSLPTYSLSDSVRNKLRNVDEGEVQNTSVHASREESIAKALRSLSSIQEDDSTKEGAAGGEGIENEAARGQTQGRASSQRPSVGGKRASMFRNRVAPGSLYATLRAASAEARPGRHIRSRSDEQTQLANIRLDVTRRSRTRPQSMLQPPPPSVSEDVSDNVSVHAHDDSDDSFKH
ncbi:hypothetical protein F5Y19DRAFT_465410 [Xylariaceae sp. FL1651]|nr:hypothetical protein F5Y19DRAFT_465410 [Xylariaceae sp. FL1651]